MDIVYIVREGEHNEELRYSLRSLAKNYPNHNKVFIAGYKPSWVRNVIHIPNKQLYSKYENSRYNFIKALNDPRVPETFARFNDDFFIMQPIEEIPTLHRGTPEEIYSRYDSTLTKGAYFYGLKETLELLEMLAVDPLKIKVYETHTPMIFEKTKARKLLEIQPKIKPLKVVHVRTLYGNYFSIGGKKIKDPKVDHIDKRMPTTSAFLSTSDASFRDLPVGQHIRDLFTERCHYER